jgi:hypothetical protein
MGRRRGISSESVEDRDGSGDGDGRWRSLLLRAGGVG